MLSHDGERFLAAGSGQEVKAFRREHALEQLSVVAFIVNDQNAGWVVSDVGARDHVRACDSRLTAARSAGLLWAVAMYPRSLILILTLEREPSEGGQLKGGNLAAEKSSPLWYLRGSRPGCAVLNTRNTDVHKYACS